MDWMVGTMKLLEGRESEKIDKKNESEGRRGEVRR